MTTQLPDSLKELLQLALHDARLCEKDPRYLLDMRMWHSPVEEGGEQRCHVCLAGAVIAKTLKESPRKTTNPSLHESSLARKLRTLDDIRMGLWPSSYGDEPEWWSSFVNSKHQFLWPLDYIQDVINEFNKRNFNAQYENHT